MKLGIIIAAVIVFAVAALLHFRKEGPADAVTNVGLALFAAASAAS